MITIFTCTTCKRRKAVFFRRASGEKLCPNCFIKGFLRSIQKTISKYEMLTPWDNIVVFFDPYIPYLSIGLMLALGIIESKFNTKMYALVPSTFNKGNLKVLDEIKSLSKYKEVNILTPNVEFKCLNDNFIKIFQEILKYISSSLKVYNLKNLKVALPYTIELLTYAHLSLWLNNMYKLLKFILPKFNTDDGTEYIYPFYGTFSNEILYFNYLNKVYRIHLSPCGRLINVQGDAIYQMVNDVALHNIELLYANLIAAKELLESNSHTISS